MELRARIVETPIGEVCLVTADGATLARVVLPAVDGAPRPPAGATVDPRALDDVAAAVRAYAGGSPGPIAAARDATVRGSAFQEAVWAALDAIPYGETRTYADVARAIGHPGAARAVGAACGANPLPLVRPCHRVVAASGLGGFAGGIAQKRALLALEAAAAR